MEIKSVTIRQVENGYVMKVEANNYEKKEYSSNSIEGILIILFEIQTTFASLSKEK